MSKHGISLKGTLDFEGTATLLGNLAKSFGEKTICLQKGAEYCTLKPGDSISFEIEAERKKNRQKLTIELSWVEALPVAEAEAVKISSVEPEPAPEPEAEAAPETPAEEPAEAPVVPPCLVIPEAAQTEDGPKPAKKDDEPVSGKKSKK